MAIINPEYCAKNFLAFSHTFADRSNAVGIATRYGLDSPGIESQ
jgi:hypothetical protein